MEETSKEDNTIKETIRDPIYRTGFDRNFWIWEKYNPDFIHFYKNFEVLSQYFGLCCRFWLRIPPMERSRRDLFIGGIVDINRHLSQEY